MSEPTVSSVAKETVAAAHEIQVDGEAITLSHSVIKTAATPAVDNPVIITDS